AMMRTDDGRIDHLQRGVRHSTSREPFQDHVPDATVGQPPHLPKDRVPVAEALRQVAPRCAGSHQPKHRVEHAAMIAWRPAADKALYALRNRIERFFNYAKNSRRVATRYDKLIESFAAFVLLACIRIWIKFVHATY